MTAPAVVLVPMGRGLVSLALRGHDAQRSRVVIVGSGSSGDVTGKADATLSRHQIARFRRRRPLPAEAELLSTYLGPIANLPSVCE